jgi:hypothetical protein
MIQSIAETCVVQSRETVSICLHQSEMEQRLKGLARRIDFHVGRGELEAASILSSDMLSIAEGRLQTATDVHYLPKEKSFRWLCRQKLVYLMTVLFIIPLVIVVAIVDFHRPLSMFLCCEAMKKGQCPEAIRTLKTEIAVDEYLKIYDQEVQCALADIYACDGQYELAKCLSSKIIEKCSDCGWAYNILGHCEYFEGHFSDAEKHFALSLEYAGDFSWNAKLMYLASAKFKQGKNVEANDVLKLMNPTEDKSPFELAVCARYLGEDQRACQLYDRLLDGNFRLLYQDDAYSYVRYLRDYSAVLKKLGEKVDAEGVSKLAAQAKSQFKLEERFLSNSESSVGILPAR